MSNRQDAVKYEGDAVVEAFRLLIADVYDLAGRSRATSDAFARQQGHSAARWHVLSVLLDEPRTVPGIADRLGLTRQSVQRVVDDLEHQGAVEFRDNPRHRRSRLIVLSAIGRDVAERLFRESQKARQSQLVAADVTSEELLEARATIRRILAAIGEIDTRGSR